MTRNRPVLIPRDPKKRAELADLAGLTDEERAAIDQWCYDQERERAQGVLLNEGATAKRATAGGTTAPPSSMSRGAGSGGSATSRCPGIESSTTSRH